MHYLQLVWWEMNDLGKLENVLGYKFSDVNLLNTALTHSSYANEMGIDSYERLEFLGDAVLELVVSNYIYNLYHVGSGDLSKLRANLVSTDNLYNIAISMQLDQYVLIAKSVSQLSKKNTADLFESVIGAVYLDGGYNIASRIIQKFVLIDESHIANVIKNGIDYKSTFQELMQSKGLAFEYKVLSEDGPAHNKTFSVGLFVCGEMIASAIGKSIRLAEEKCAKEYLEKNS